LWAAPPRARARGPHDVKDALNGVSVNLEVIRSRAARGEAPAATVAPYADAAAQQLDRLTGLLEAVLALGRSEREPADVGITLRRVVTLCSASSAATDARVVVRDASVGDTHTRVPGDVVRLALVSPLLEAVVGRRGEPHGHVECELASEADAIVVRLHAGRPMPMPPEVAEPLRAAGVTWSESADELSLVFPRA
jgi:hypothetical protein